jgi:copper chaperone
MKTLKFKTNINCMGCVGSVKPFLDQESQISEWKVDIENPGKILTVTTSLEEEEVEKLLEKAGFMAEMVK